MLLPKKTKFRKAFKGKNVGLATRGTEINFGRYGLQAMGNERITSRQIEAARRAMTRYIKRGGKIWIRIFPHTPVTSKPAEVRMGSGKGALSHYVAKVQAGRILCSRWMG
jgi:large subunit ribosomal protein L16